MARKKQALQKTSAGFQIMITDEIDKKAMSEEIKAEAIESLKKTVAEQKKAIEKSINLSDVIKMVTDPAPDGFLDRLAHTEITPVCEQLNPQPVVEQMKMQLDFPADKEENRRKHIKEAHERHEMAKREGSLDSGETTLATISEKTIGFDYFTSAVVKTLPAGIETFILDDQGRINLYDLTGGNKPIEEVLQEVDKLHTAFLMWLLALAWNNGDIRERNSGNAIIPVYLPKVLKDMGIDPRPHWNKELKQNVKRDTAKTLSELRLAKFMEFLRPLRNVAAFFGGDLYQIVGFYSYNVESETVYISVPYMYRLVEYAKLNATKHAAITSIFHADIMTENQTAVEIANRIAMGLVQRGVTTPDSNAYQSSKPRKPIKKKITTTAPDGTKKVEELTFQPEQETIVSRSRTNENGITTTITGPRKKERNFTFSIKFSALIADCPQLKREIDQIRADENENKSQRVNKKLSDVFSAAIRIIMEKSEIPRYYKQLTIKTGKFDTFKAPTNSTLSDLLIITHNGKNPDFVN